MAEENLREILFGGQTFSWRDVGDGIFASALNDRVYRIRTIDDAYSDPFLHRYFDLDYDYEKARNEIRKRDSILEKAVDSVGKLRILRQDEWTSVISFILSQNNNIRRITGLYDRISCRYGKKVGDGFYTFPRPEDFGNVTEDELRGLGVGFRAPFIISALEKRDIFEEVKSLSYEDALARLQSVRGIGPKVASCILIFGYGRREGFPVDTWMRKCLDMYYPGVDISYFHPYEALSQQYLFSYMRHNESSRRTQSV